MNLSVLAYGARAAAHTSLPDRSNACTSWTGSTSNDGPVEIEDPALVSRNPPAPHNQDESLPASDSRIDVPQPWNRDTPHHRSELSEVQDRENHRRDLSHVQTVSLNNVIRRRRLSG